MRGLALFALPVTALAKPNGLAKTPPMGWMSWQTFRCEIDCTTYPDSCISEELYKTHADLLVSEGYAAAGYTGVHLDDCILDKTGRDAQGNMRADSERFPSGFKDLGDFLHVRNLTFAFYTAESSKTCGGWPGSKGYEEQDAKAMAEWGVDYLKADGCGPASYYPEGYRKLGEALQATGRDMVYSCSWPAYLGNDETEKPFATMIAYGCNLWRNFIDMGPTSGYLQGILEHWGNYSDVLARWAGPGHFHDPDQMLIGTDGISDDMARSNMALFCIVAAPLVMGNDLRKVTDAQKAILLNPHAIAVNQDPLGQMGVRLGGAAAENAPGQIWFRVLANGDVAVALYNAGPKPKHTWHTACDDFNETTGGYWAPSGAQPDSWCSSALGKHNLEWYCCNTEDCAGYNYSSATGVGCMFKDVDGEFVSAGANVSGFTKPRFAKPSGSPMEITVNFGDVGIFPDMDINVFDIWAGKVVATTNSSYTATVPWQGSAFLRLSVAPSASAVTAFV